MAPDAVREFDSIYESHADFVWRNLRRLGVPESELDDAFQDAFLVVHRKLHAFEGRSSMRTWLFGIVRRVSASHRRKGHRRDGLETLDDHQVEFPGTSPLEHATRTQAVETLCEVLATLSEDRRDVFVLIELEELPGPEVAALLGINLNTMYTRLRSARADFEQAVSRQMARNQRTAR